VGKRDLRKRKRIRLILGRVGKLGIEEFHGEVCKEWKKMYAHLCVILMEDG